MTLVANAVPLVGVIVFDWSLVALLVVYWFELGIDLVFALFEGVFAERPPMYDDPPTEALLFGALITKRGGIPLPFVRPRIRVANLPAIGAALFAFGIAWMLAGGVGVGGVGEATGGTPDERALASAGFGIMALFVRRLVETGGYFLYGEYKESSVGLSIRSAIYSMIGIGAAMFFGGIAVLGGAPSSLVLVVVIGMKLLFDVARVYRDRLVAFDERDQLDLGLAVEPDEWPSVDTELTEPVETFRPHRGALVVDGVVRGLTSPVLAVVGFFALCFGLLGVGTGSWDFVELVSRIVVGILGLLAGVGLVDRICRALWMRYDVADGVVAHDWLFGPQWDISEEQFSEASVTNTLADQLFGTTSVVVELDDRVVRLRHLSDSGDHPWV